MGVKRQFMAEQWNTFAAKVLPIGCPERQRRETRRGFYAGAHALLNVIGEFDPGPEPTEQDVKFMEDLDQKLKEFATAVKMGKA